MMLPLRDSVSSGGRLTWQAWMERTGGRGGNKGAAAFVRIQEKTCDCASGRQGALPSSDKTKFDIIDLVL